MKGGVFLSVEYKTNACIFLIKVLRVLKVT